MSVVGGGAWDAGAVAACAFALGAAWFAGVGGAGGEASGKPFAGVCSRVGEGTGAGGMAACEGSAEGATGAVAEGCG